MAEGSSSQKVSPHLVAEIVSSFVAKNRVPVDQVGGLIATIHQTLSGLGSGEPTPTPAPLVPAVPVRRSVQPDYVVCLECGFRAKTLRRHLRMHHGLEVGAYRAPLEVTNRSPDDSTSLFGAPLGDGQTARAGAQAEFGRAITCLPAAGSAAPASR